MRLRLDISPCPNDTFMFDALVNGRIDTEGLAFEVRYHDIEALNRGVTEETEAQNRSATREDEKPGATREGGSRNVTVQDENPNRHMPGRGTHTGMRPPHPDISKISCAVLPAIASRYELLDSGAALGHGNGPLLVRRVGDTAPLRRIAVPGLHTTANALIGRLFPQIGERTPVLFSQIADRVAQGEFDAGVLIHEGRFVYHKHNLELVADLGLLWEQRTALPLPLGGIVASRELPESLRRQVERLLRASIEYAFAHPEVSRTYIKSHAQELDDRVIDAHIALFVNEYSLSLGNEGRRAVGELTGIRV